MNSVLRITVGQLLPIFEATITDVDGVPVDLTGATVLLRLDDYEGDNASEDFACDIVTPATAGMVEYTWQAGETDDAGNYRGHLIGTWSDGSRTMPSQGFLTVLIQP